MQQQEHNRFVCIIYVAERKTGDSAQHRRHRAGIELIRGCNNLTSHETNRRIAWELHGNNIGTTKVQNTSSTEAVNNTHTVTHERVTINKRQTYFGNW
jgi:hypothetical protein